MMFASGTRARQIDQVGVLVVVDQCVERQSHGGQPIEAGAEVGAQIVAGPGAMVIVADHRVLVPAGRIANAAKTAPACLDQCGQYGLHAIAERQVGVADDAGGDARLATMFGIALRREARDELDLADGTQLGRPVRPIVGGIR